MYLWFWSLILLGLAGVPGDAVVDTPAAPTRITSTASPAEPASPAAPDRPASPDSPASPSRSPEAQEPTGRFTTATEVRPILTATRPNWVAVREYDGQDLVYVTQIMAWRCGLVALRFAVNDAPLADWPLPPCHLDSPTPNALTPEDGLPYRAFPLGSVRTVTVELIYDDLSTDAAAFVRRNVLMP